jgi:tRNA(Arg) A34 adenosine deaminase TadA
MELDALGSLKVACHGIEMGQGLTTKLLQIAVYATGIPSPRVQMVDIMSSTSFTDGTKLHLPGTGASTGTDLNGRAILVTAASLVEWLQQKLPESRYPHVWQFRKENSHRWYRTGADGVVEDFWSYTVVPALRNEASLPHEQIGEYSMADLKLLQGIDPITKQGAPFYFFNYAACCCVVEVDCLTGELDVISCDILYDAGVSLNPAIDIGQVEGGFVQGLGCVTCEEILVRPADGRLLSDSTWTYKIPTTTEIPRHFTVTLYPDAHDVALLPATALHEHVSALESMGTIHQLDLERETRKRFVGRGRDVLLDSFGVHSSKTTGEPPLVLANSVFFAIKMAVHAFRKQQHTAADDWSHFLSHTPATTYEIALACDARSSIAKVASPAASGAASSPASASPGKLRRHSKTKRGRGRRSGQTSASASASASPSRLHLPWPNETVKSHAFYMHKAIELAKQASAAGNHPFGALLVDDMGNVVLTAENSVHSTHDSTAHAELNLMRAVGAAQKETPFDPRRCVLYTSTEPCAMCCGAIYWTGVRTVVYGCPASLLEVLAGQSLLMSCTSLFMHGVETTDVIGPVCLEEALLVHKQYDWPSKLGIPNVDPDKMASELEKKKESCDWTIYS